MTELTNRPAGSGTKRPVSAAIRRGVGTRPRRWHLVGTLLLGVLAAVLAVAVGGVAEPTFAGANGLVQILMSVMVPLTGILLVTDLRRPRAGLGLPPTLLAALALAIGVALWGAAVAAVAVATAGASTPGRWDAVGALLLGGLLVQSLAVLVGTGLGLLLRPVPLTFVATALLPLGLHRFLGVAGPLEAAQPWLTPFAAAQNLLSGAMGPLTWAQWLVVVLLWGVGLNVLGALRLRSRR